jgi:hypothetical protein
MSRLRAAASAQLAVGAGGLVVTILAIMARDYPWVGHDFRYFIPRLVDTDLHLRLNGPAIQWYTPTFGGGLPAFPNPQHLQYSLIQAMTLVVDPWRAVLVTTAVVAVAGYLALYRVARASLGLTPGAALLCAIFFVGNGFWIEHLIVGHLGFQLFPLGAVMLSALIDARRPAMVNGALLAFVAAMMLYQGGFYLLIILGLSMALTLPVLAFYRTSLIDWRRISTIAGVALLLFAGIGAPKAYATMSFMRQFPREAADVYPIGLLQALAGFVAQLTGAMVIAPLLALLRMDPSRVSGALMKLTGADVRSGVWEMDTGLSPVLIVVLAIGLAWLARDFRAHGWPKLQPAQKRALALLAVGTWIAIEATLARGFIYPFLKQLPVLSSLHVNHRLAAAFILPLSIIGAILIDRWQGRSRRQAWTWVLMVTSAFSPAAFLLLPAQTHLRTFDVTASIEASRLARDGDHFEVAAIVDGDDAAALVARGSSLQPYEPLFGYVNETFTPQVHAGDVHDATGGFLNMTNPASLVFPEINGVRPFDRIAVSERDKLDAFVARRQPEWKVPTVAQWLNWTGVACLLLSVALLLIDRRRRTPSGSR